MADELRNVLRAHTQRRYAQRKDVQAIKEVRPERLCLDHLFEVAIGGCNQSRVRSERARAAEALELPLLKHAKQLRLQLERDFADLVQEHGPAVRELEASDPLRDGAGERALLVPEQLALEEACRDRRAVQLHERIGLPGAEVVNGAGHQLLARAGLAVDQHR